MSCLAAALENSSPTLDAAYSLGALLSFFVSGKGSRDSEKVHFPFKYHESYEYISPKLPK